MDEIDELSKMIHYYELQVARHERYMAIALTAEERRVSNSKAYAALEASIYLRSVLKASQAEFSNC